MNSVGFCEISGIQKFQRGHGGLGECQTNFNGRCPVLVLVAFDGEIEISFPTESSYATMPACATGWELVHDLEVKPTKMLYNTYVF